MPSGSEGGVGVALEAWPRSIPGADTIRSETRRRDCRPSFADDVIGSPSLEKDIAEVGAVNLRMTHGAGLIFRGLIVRGSGRPLGRERMTLQTEHVHQADFEK